MTLPVPLTLRVKTSRTDRDLTAVLRDLRIRSSIPGGFERVEASFDRPLTFRPDEVAYGASVYVYDGRSGRTVGEGRLEDPERHAGSSGQIWGLTAFGAAAHASDQTIPYIPVDTSLERWTRAVGTSPILTANPDSQTAAPGYRLQVDRGKVAAVGGIGGIEYLPIEIIGGKIARVSYSYTPGNADANWRHQLLASNGGTTTASDIGFNAGAGSVSRVIGTDWVNGRTRAQIRMARNTGAVTVADDATLVWLTGVAVRSLLLAPDGTERLPTGSTTLNHSYSTDTVLAEDIVRDLLGRLLTRYDGINAPIATSTYGIEQLAYPDGITAAGVLADLMALEPNTFWAAWETLANGKYRFEWSRWPTSVDYETSTVDGFDSPSPGDDMYDKVIVRYRGAHGATRTVTRTQVVPQLAAAGISRTGYIDLGDEGGGANNANQVGDLFLAQHQAPPNKGTLTIARPILSRSEGRMVAPWEIRPGRLIRVQDVEPTVDALNATTRDGVSIFRIIAVDYSTADNTATLELDSYARSTPRALADLQNNPALSRRRR